MKVECSLNAISGLAQLPNIKQGLVYKLELGHVINDTEFEAIGTYDTLTDTFVKVFWYNSLLPSGMTSLLKITPSVSVEQTRLVLKYTIPSISLYIFQEYVLENTYYDILCLMKLR